MTQNLQRYIVFIYFDNKTCMLPQLVSLLRHLGPYSAQKVSWSNYKQSNTFKLLESKIDPVLDFRLRLGLKAQKMVLTKHFES